MAESNPSATHSAAQKSQKLFETVENAGTEITYRCVDCRGCINCKRSEQIEYATIQEVEQNLINKSVTVDIIKCETVAQLPFISNPKLRLSPNRFAAVKIYDAQVRKLNKNPSDMNDVIQFEKKLHDLAFVDFLENLTEEQQGKVLDSEVQYYLPWRPVWNTNSVSTKCRLVFDASHLTASGYNLNSILAKGRNSMNKLVEITIRWQTHVDGFHTDISKMYNVVKLCDDDWCYQLYFWDNDLRTSREPKTKVIKTLIYGVKSSRKRVERDRKKVRN